MASVIVRPARSDDIAQLVNLQFEVYPPPHFPRVNRWAASQLEAHQRIFAEGQPVAELAGRIVGAATTMVVPAEQASRPHTFADITGGAFLANHHPQGDALYGVDMLVSPYFRGRGISRALYDARFALQRKLGLAHFYAGARIPGYLAYQEQMWAEEYVAKLVLGEVEDPTLSIQLHLGFRIVGLLPDYLPDPETGDWAVLIDHRLDDNGEEDRP